MQIRISLAAASALFLLAPHASANDPDLFSIETFVTGFPNLGIQAGSNDVVTLIEDFLEQQGDFGGLGVLLGYQGRLAYLGIQDAIVFDISNRGTTAVVAIPTIGTTQVFNGADPEDVANQIEDWVKQDALGEWSRFLKAANALSPLALLSGNPRSSVARMGSDPYRRFGFDDSRSRMGYEKEITRWGGFELRVDAGASTVSTSEFDDDLWSVAPTVSLAGNFGDTVGLSLSLIGQYRDYNGAQLADLGLELALPLSLKRPGPHDDPWFWQLTPFVQAAAGVSINLAAGGIFMGGGLVNAIGFNHGNCEYLMTNEIAYYGGLPVGNIGDYDFETDLSQLLFKNGIEGTWWLGAGFYLDAGIHFTNFVLDDAAVNWYTTPTAGIGFRAGRWMDIRIAYEGDFSTDSYQAHGAQLKLDFLF